MVVLIPMKIASLEGDKRDADTMRPKLEKKGGISRRPT